MTRISLAVLSIWFGAVAGQALAAWEVQYTGDKVEFGSAGKLYARDAVHTFSLMWKQPISYPHPSKQFSGYIGQARVVTSDGAPDNTLFFVATCETRLDHERWIFVEGTLGGTMHVLGAQPPILSEEVMVHDLWWAACRDEFGKY